MESYAFGDKSHLDLVKVFPYLVSKGFLQSEVLGKVCALEGGSPGRSFCRSLGRSFWWSFRAFPCWDMQGKKRLQQKLQPKIPTAPAQQNWWKLGAVWRVAGMSRDLGRDVPDLEKLYARKLWADSSYPNMRARSEKRFPGPLGPGVKKVEKEAEKRLKKLKKGCFWLVFDLFFDFFQPFLTPGPRGPGNLFSTFFGIWGPKGPNDSCKGPGRLQGEESFGWKDAKTWSHWARVSCMPRSHLIGFSWWFRCYAWRSRGRGWRRQPTPTTGRLLLKHQGAFDHDKGQKSAISGRRLHWIFWIFSSGCFSFFSRFSV